LVVLSGVIMLALSVFLLKGLRNAWIAAVILSSLSLVAHLTKGIDWEEAILALLTLSTLMYQHKSYNIRPDFRLARRSIWPGRIAVAGVLLFGTIGFYLLNPSHFNVNFSLWQSFQEALTTFLLINIDLKPATPFANQFLMGMHILGGTTLAFLAYLLLRPLVSPLHTQAEADHQKALALVEKYGSSSLDYFKTYADKLFWFAADGESCIAFKIARNYALVLENPVAKDEAACLAAITAFEAYCRKNGLRASYYRLPAGSKERYEKLGKKLLPIGQEAIVNLETWTMTGHRRQNLRTAINKRSKQGYVFQVNRPPQNDAFLQQLRAVSDAWLRDMDRSELVFSQGQFDETELKNQVILSLENAEGKVVGFINLIPDSIAGEANFDLMRKTEDAPHGTMDFLFAKLFEYLQGEGFKTC
ncbi:MAG: DUF2156 domain-containing protein, partial [Phaeodactylibacter sp.]|nr:DUF2156 domain-containing protein [Phaeodactylibacter sp.]